MNYLPAYIQDFFSLFYPRLCHSCKKALVKNEECLCSFCHFHLPLTNLHLERENSLTRIFWGRVEIETATALFYFQKGGNVQNLIHQFKYKGKKDIGNYLGQMLAGKLKDNPIWQPVDIIVPVPMHRKKKHKRGFNQSEVIAGGMKEILRKPLTANNLVKIDKTETQTRKTRFKRWENVESVFHVKNPEAFRGKNILIVDDVVTTGSTLEACCQKIKEIRGTRIWVATLAMSV